MGALISCSDDYLDRQPLNNPSDGTFLSTQTEVEMALTGCYTGLWTNYEGMPFQLSFDMVTDIGYERNGSGMQAVGRSDHDASTNYINQIWTDMYAAISKCNYLLTNMDRAADVMEASDMENIRAEARFLRALYYHYLVFLYGDVPLVTTPIGLSETNVPRTPKEEVVDFILDELEQSVPYLSQTNAPLSGRATKGAAWALISRVALYTERWEQSINAAESAMALEGSQFIIDPNYMDLFQYAGEGSLEIMFSVQYLQGANVHPMYRLFGSRNGNAHTNKKPAYQLSDVWECTDGLQIDESPLFDPQNPYANRDPRLGHTLAVSGSTFLGFQYETHGDSISCWNYNENPPKRVPNLEATHAYATFTGVGWRKYADVLDRTQIDNSELNTIIFRYAEVLLNYAEAKIEAGQIDNTVLEAINKIRQRPSVNMPPITTMDPNELRAAVRRERKYEFAGEGLRLFDIRRWQMAEEVMTLPVLGRMKKSYPTKAPRVDQWGTVYYEDIPVAAPGEPSDFQMRMVENRSFDPARDYLWPIPFLELQTNEAMDQNPGY
tara:strand:+ start:80084 stop:81736 length:1653 start_codon:yes stop_codon:yes gene_type:complete